MSIHKSKKYLGACRSSRREDVTRVSYQMAFIKQECDGIFWFNSTQQFSSLASTHMASLLLCAFTKCSYSGLISGISLKDSQIGVIHDIDTVLMYIMLPVKI